MADHKGTVLVIGATGQQGGATVTHLLEGGRTVRALVRDPDSAAAYALQRAGASLVLGDLDDPVSLRTAMEGRYGVFLVLTMMVGRKISPEGVIAEERRGTAVADLALESPTRLRRPAGPDVHVLASSPENHPASRRWG